MLVTTKEGESSGVTLPQGHATEPSPEPSIETEEIFDLLSNHRRRFTLQYLRENGDESDLRTLSEQIAAWENDVEPAHVTSKQRMRAYTALRQSHLPKMDRYGIIDFDSRSGTVGLTDSASALEDYLESVASNRTPWGQYYLGMGLLGTILSVGVYFDPVPLGVVPDAVAGVAVSVAVLVLAGLHIYENSKPNRIPLDSPDRD